MNPVLIIISFLIDKGIPATIRILKAWEKKDPTFQDFQALQDMMKRPEDF